MMHKKPTVIASAIVMLGIGSGTGALLNRSSRAQNPPPAAPTKPAAGAEAPKPSDADRLLAELIQAARQTQEAQKGLYETGTTTFDRYLDAGSELVRVELLAAKTEAERRAIRQRQVDLAKQIEAFAKLRRDAAQGTFADIAKARQRRIQAEYDMITVEKEDAEKAALLRRIAELERRVDQLEKERAGRK
jgi:hypothetical protein